MKSIEDITGFDELIEEQNHSTIPTLVDSETSDENLIPEEVEESSPQSLPDENSHYEQLWNSFSNVLTSTDRAPAQKRLFCKIDSDLAYTIDMCRLGNFSRIEIVNAIVRTFLTDYKEKFKEIRESKETLF